ncbi:MAG TPA: type I restriction-modification system subunit M N-terminal domain-containing protein, partial [Candidatus Binatia bacterium]|nr:type I restriction-modification system subunit M N-terminal domain-containing protein [Candidatus Binatia bacterium]
MTKDELKQLEADLWHAADNLRANSDLKASEYSTPVLGLTFLEFADNNYCRHEAEIIALASPARRMGCRLNLAPIYLCLTIKTSTFDETLRWRHDWYRFLSRFQGKLGQSEL